MKEFFHLFLGFSLLTGSLGAKADSPTPDLSSLVGVYSQAGTFQEILKSHSNFLGDEDRAELGRLIQKYGLKEVPALGVKGTNLFIKVENQVIKFELAG